MQTQSFKKSFNILLATLIVSSYLLTSGVALFRPQIAHAATYTVTNTNDSGAGSLRQAILDANSNPGADIIVFDNAYTIQPTSALPSIDDPVEINGYTGSPGGATANSAASPAPFNGTITVELDGQLAGAVDGLLFVAGSEGSSVRGLTINRFQNAGIQILSSSNITIAGNYIGTSADGTTDLGNSINGVYIHGTSTGNVVGGNAAADRNILSGNDNDGVAITDAATTTTTVAGNYLGLDAAGTGGLGNVSDGVSMELSTSANTVGGTTSASTNVISGNGNGVNISSSSSNAVSGNYIGTTYTANAALANGNDGLQISGTSTSNVVGGDTAGERNIISGNIVDGVDLANAGVTGNTISGNYIGTNVDGTADLGNAGSGIFLHDSASQNTIGGASEGLRNVISGNNTGGIQLTNSSSNTIAGNYIGTSASGLSDLGNTFNGVMLSDGSASNTIGGTTAGARNIISGNSNSGVATDGGGTPAGSNNVIQGNYLGLGSDGVTDLGNDQNGIGLFDADDTIVGGTSAGARNVASGNGQNGIVIQPVSLLGVSNNQVLGNYVGSDYTGTVGVGNDGAGITINAGTGTGNTIGNTTSGSRNVVIDNAQNGIAVNNSVTVQGNYVGIKADGSGALGNGTSSPNFGNFAVSDGSGSVVGGNTPAARNYIAGAQGAGITVSGNTPLGGSSTSDVTIQGNCVGTNLNCEVESGYGNGGVGISAFADVDNVVIGGTASGEGNVVAGNGAGIVNIGFTTYTPTNVSILGNSIHDNSGYPLTDIGIDNVQTNNFVDFINIGVTLNDANDIDYNGTNIGTNHYLNFPEISSVTSTNGTATITYDLDINDSETGATGYRVEFFANDTADANGYGQGQTYLGSDTISGDVTGRQATITLPAGVDGSKQITAVTIMADASTDGFGHSSEFAADVEATLVPVVAPSPTSSVLASTGRNIKWIGLVAAILLASGGVGLYVAQRKRNFLQK